MKAEKDKIAVIIRQTGTVLDTRLQGQWGTNPLAFFYKDQEFFSYTISTSRALEFLKPEVLDLFRSVWAEVKPGEEPEHIDCNILRSKPGTPQRVWATIFVFSDPTPGLIRAQMGPDNPNLILKPGHTMARETDNELSRLAMTLAGYPETAARLGLMLAETASDPRMLEAASLVANPLFVH